MHNQLRYLTEKACLFICGFITDKLLLLHFQGAFNVKVVIYFSFFICMRYHFLKTLINRMQVFRYLINILFGHTDNKLVNFVLV